MTNKEAQLEAQRLCVAILYNTNIDFEDYNEKDEIKISNYIRVEAEKIYSKAAKKGGNFNRFSATI
jgi:hypothetical protein